ncbi:MAG: hypothetical protein AB8H79_18595 [Myxococcota bacterium]
MNIVLIPHNWSRHVAVAFYTGAVPVVIWWIMVNWLVGLGPTLHENGLLWIPEAEGPILFGVMAAAIAWVHIAAEGGLRRRALVWKVLLPFVAAVSAMLLTVLLVLLLEFLTPMIAGLRGPSGAVFQSPHTVTLRHRIAEWVISGLVVGNVTMLVRGVWSFTGSLARFIPDRIKTFVELPENPAKLTFGIAVHHVLGGVAAALVGAGVWHLCAAVIFKDMYLASALGFGAWGFSFGLLAWGVPENLYAGWIRVLSNHRFGHRIPIDTPEGGPVERVMGHYPRGLDLWVGAENGVAELHASFVVDAAGGYAVRGLSQQPIGVKRALEAVDLAYDPASPVPLETDLRMEDRVIIGPPGNHTLVEFILLPKEER